MLLKYFYDKPLAQASYMVGCQRSGEALVIDPGRDVEPYLRAAEEEGLRIVAATETHIHADFVSGSRELADRVGAKLYLSDEGTADWKYAYADQYDSQLLHEGDDFFIGNVKFTVMHTPGHTPESISLVLTDQGGGADRPLGIFTGDFVFVGSIGRPDLLETAAGVVGSAVAGARQLYHSMRRFRELPDHLQVWPAHGAGSACGKGLGAIPSTTVGYEKLFNPALQFSDEPSFVDYILADQPETPYYFAVMKRVNKLGPRLLRNLPSVESLDVRGLPDLAQNQLVIDTVAVQEFGMAHVPGTLNIPAGMLVQWAGFLVDYSRPLYLITESGTVASHLRALRSIGIDDVAGYFAADVVQALGLRTESYPSAKPEQLRAAIEQKRVHLFDVRSASEYNAGHIPEAEHRFLGGLLRNLDTVPTDKPLVLQCQSGRRSAVAASLLQRAGFEVTNMTGGYQAWSRAGLPVACSSSAECTA